MEIQVFSSADSNKMQCDGLTGIPGKSKKERQEYQGRVKAYTHLSESRSGLGGLFEYLGPILALLGVMVTTN